MGRFQKVKFAFNAVTLLPVRCVALCVVSVVGVSVHLEPTPQATSCSVYFCFLSMLAKVLHHTSDSLDFSASSQNSLQKKNKYRTKHKCTCLFIYTHPLHVAPVGQPGCVRPQQQAAGDRATGSMATASADRVALHRATRALRECSRPSHPNTNAWH